MLLSFSFSTEYGGSMIKHDSTLFTLFIITLFFLSFIALVFFILVFIWIFCRSLAGAI